MSDYEPNPKEALLLRRASLVFSKLGEHSLAKAVGIAADEWDAPRLCESCPEPATTSDCEGVPLCEGCAGSLTNESLAAATARTAHDDVIDGLLESLCKAAPSFPETVPARIEAIGALRNERDSLRLALEVTKEAGRKLDAENVALRAKASVSQGLADEVAILRVGCDEAHGHARTIASLLDQARTERDEAQRELAAIVINAERASIVINDSGDEPAERTLSHVLQAVKGSDSEGARSYFRKIQAERDEFKACWHRDLAKARVIEADLRETAELHRKDAVTLHKQRDAACTEAAELRAKLAVSARPDPHVRLTALVERLESAFLDVSPEHGERQGVARVLVRELRNIADDLVHARSTTRTACTQLGNLIKAYGR